MNGASAAAGPRFRKRNSPPSPHTTPPCQCAMPPSTRHRQPPAHAPRPGRCVMEPSSSRRRGRIHHSSAKRGGADFRASNLKRCTSPAGLSPGRSRVEEPGHTRGCSGLTPGCSTSCPCHVCDHATMRATRRCSTVARPMSAMSATTRYLAWRRAQLTRRVARIAVTNPSVVTRVRHLRICERPRFLRRASAAFLPLRW